MRYMTGKKGLGNQGRSVTHYITGLIVLRIEFVIIFRQEKDTSTFDINFSKRRLTPGQPAGQPDENAYFPGFRRRTHKLVCLVNRPVVPGSTGP